MPRCCFHVLPDLERLDATARSAGGNMFLFFSDRQNGRSSFCFHLITKRTATLEVTKVRNRNCCQSQHTQEGLFQFSNRAVTSELFFSMLISAYKSDDLVARFTAVTLYVVLQRCVGSSHSQSATMPPEMPSK